MRNYIKYRLKGFSIRKSAELADLYVWRTVLTVLLVLWVIYNGFTLYGFWVDSKMVTADSMQQRARADNYEAALIGCLNHGTLDINRYTHSCEIKKL